MPKRSTKNQGMSRVTIMLIAVAILLIVVLIVAYFIYQRNPQNENTNTTTNLNTNQATTNLNVNNSLNTNTSTNVNLNLNTAPTTTDAKIKAELQRIAINFTEIWGSYSNQSDFENILDLKVFMTEKMGDWADDYVKNAKENQPAAGIYYGVTSKVLSAKVSKFDKDKGTAEFLVTTQRKESTGTVANSRIFYQDNIIKFEKEGGVWKVAGSFWQ
ncbi:MAG: hypothetical protein ABIB97_02555 [Patescibacteria group bacterium]